MGNILNEDGLILFQHHGHLNGRAGVGEGERGRGREGVRARSYLAKASGDK